MLAFDAFTRIMIICMILGAVWGASALTDTYRNGLIVSLIKRGVAALLGALFGFVMAFFVAVALGFVLYALSLF